MSLHDFTKYAASSLVDEENSSEPTTEAELAAQLEQAEYDEQVSNVKGLHPVISTAEERRERIRQETLAALRDSLEVDSNNFKVEVEDLKIDEKNYTLKEQKEALLAKKSLTEPVKAKLVIKDKKTGDIVDRANRVVARLPWMSPRHTFTIDGNEYGISNQLRIKPGVYTRMRGNEELEASFNLGRGKNFRVYMVPATGVFNVQYDSTSIPLYPILKALGVSDEKLSKQWGNELLSANKKANTSTERNILKLYKKLYSVKERGKTVPSQDEMIAAIAEKYDRTVLKPEVTKATLGQEFNKVTPEALLASSKKLLGVFNGTEEEDDRDSLEFKTLHTVDTFFSERLKKNAGPVFQYKVRSKLNRTSVPKIKDIVPSTPFTAPLRALVTTSSLSANPTQINPMEIIDSAAKVTSLGEGGISSLRAVPDAARDQHSSHAGILGIVRTPESGGVGVDVRAASYASVDEKGNMYTLLANRKKRKLEYVPAHEFARKNVAFPSTDWSKDKIPVLNNNKVLNVSKDEVDYALPNDAALFSPATNMVPNINSMQGNRAIMASKQITQSVPLLNREAPHVQVRMKGKDTMESYFGKWHLPVAPEDGTVEKVDEDNDQIVIKDKQGKTHKIDFAKDFPFASKTRLHHELVVKPGDKIKKGQHLADSNFTKNGTWAGGTNLRVGYAAWHGLNSNDALLISESAAKDKLSSEHMYRETLPLTGATEASKEKHRVYFGAKHTADEYSKLDDNGVARKGTEILPGELIIAAVAKQKQTAQDALLGRLSKNLVKPYRDASVRWEHGHKGVVKDVQVTPKNITVTVYTVEPMGIGDKLSNRYGGKGVVSRVLPDDQMPQDESGKPLEVLLTSAGVVSRINPGQIIETALGKVARKTGEAISLAQFPKESRVKMAKTLLKKHGLKDKETLFDPVSGKKIPGIMTGEQYFLKLFKSTDTNFSARGVGSTDANRQPTKGGVEGAKSFGRMDLFAFIAHDARNVLREGATIKSDKNEEYWRRVQLGLPESNPKPSYAFNKFKSMLVGGGMNVQKQGDQFQIMPLTDRDIDAMARNEIKNPGVIKIKSSKSGVKFEPETGGLFDPAITGGTEGTRWAKITLAEPIVNPVFEKPARELLGMTSKQFGDAMYKEGGAALRTKLNSLDLDTKEKELRELIKTKINKRSPSSITQVDQWTRQLKYIRALKEQKLKAGDAYVLSKIPVIPPTMRSVVVTDNKQMLISDPNFLYKDVMVVNDAIKTMPEELKAIDDPAERRKQLHSSVKALFGLGDPVNPKTKGRGVRGFMTQITGQNSPKQGFFHEKLLKKRQQLSGRGTIAPDPSLHLDEIGIPEEALWKQYSPFVMRRLSKKGYPALQAKQLIEDRHPAARQELISETKSRPMLVNRAPTLHRFNMIAAYPKPVPGKTIRLNPFAEIGMNADYDGDAMQTHVPASAAAVNEAREMTLSNLIFADGQKNSLMVRPQHEAIFGAYMASTKANGPVKKFKTLQDAQAAYNRGEITMSTPIELEQKQKRFNSPQ